MLPAFNQHSHPGPKPITAAFPPRCPGITGDPRREPAGDLFGEEGAVPQGLLRGFSAIRFEGPVSTRW